MDPIPVPVLNTAQDQSKYLLVPLGACKDMKSTYSDNSRVALDVIGRVTFNGDGLRLFLLL